MAPRATICFAVLTFVSAVVLMFTMYRNLRLLSKLEQCQKEYIKVKNTLADVKARNVRTSKPQAQSTQRTVVQKCSREKTLECAANVWGYENPVVDYRKLPKERIARYRTLPDEIYDWQKLRRDQDDLIEFLMPYGAELEIQANFMVGPLDQWGLYTMTRYFKPRRIIEVGSGYSTRVLHLAMLANRKDGYTTEITCIEPFRADKISEDIRADISIINKEVQNVDVSVFKQLEPGDFLIIDNSHVMQPYGDTILEYTFIAPLVPEGTIVHFHDIFTPDDYPARWMKGRRQYTEQWMFAAFIFGNEHFKIVLSIHNLDTHSKHRDEIRETVEYETKDKYEMNGLDSGIWLIRDKTFNHAEEVVRPKSLEE